MPETPVRAVMQNVHVSPMLVSVNHFDGAVAENR
jgi:hypothetical protein